MMDDDLFSINMNLVLLGTNIKYIDFLYDDYKIKQENLLERNSSLVNNNHKIYQKQI